MMELRPYQEKFKQDVYSLFRQGKQSVLAQLPTGAGKTIIFSSMIRDGVAYNRRCLVLAHRGELIQQAADKLWQGYGVSCGIIKNGFKPRPDALVQIASVQTLINRTLPFPVDFVIIDEAHHMQGRNTYGKIRDHVLELKPNAKFLGVTATPCRSNGAGFKDIFEEIVTGPTIKELIADGYLVKPKYYTCPIDLKSVKMSAGDYNISDLLGTYRQRVDCEELIKNWRRYADGLKTIGFAINVEHSKEIVSAYQEAGIKAAHIDGTTPDHERKSLLNDFREGRIEVLFNVGVFDEGFDCPDIEAVQLARPSKSLIKFMQMIGRALRPADGKSEAIVLDHAGLLPEHDLVERDRRWTLGGTEITETKKAGIKDLSTGRIYEMDKAPRLPMNLIELVEIDRDFAAMSPEQKITRDFQVLTKFADKRGFHRLWVWHQLARKISKGRSDYNERITELASVYCEKAGYKPAYAEHLIKDYVKN